MRSSMIRLLAAFLVAWSGFAPSFAAGPSGGVTQTQSVTSYLGQVATRSQVSSVNTTANKQLMSRTIHYARDNITSLQAEFGNFWVDATTGTELGNGAVMTIRASIEYPLGTTPQQFTFSGSTTGTIADVGRLRSDALSVTIPNGAAFAIRSWQSSTVGLIFINEWPFVSGDMIAFGTTTPDLTAASTTFAASTGIAFPPVALIANTTRPSVWIGLDSKAAGIKDTGDSTGDHGEFARAIGGQLAYINASRGSVRTSQFVSANGAVNRIALAQLCSAVVWQGGINDITNSRTSAQLVADTITALGLLGKPFTPATLVPYSTTTDGQTASSFEAVRTTFNDAVRGGAITGAAGFIELADIVENGRNGGKWARSTETQDGVHETKRGNLAIQASGRIPASLFAR